MKTSRANWIGRFMGFECLILTVYIVFVYFEHFVILDLVHSLRVYTYPELLIVFAYGRKETR